MTRQVECIVGNVDNRRTSNRPVGVKFEQFAEGETVVDDAEAIDKTFPTFVEVMRSLGASIEQNK